MRAALISFSSQTVVLFQITIYIVLQAAKVTGKRNWFCAIRTLRGDQAVARCKNWGNDNRGGCKSKPHS